MNAHPALNTTQLHPTPTAGWPKHLVLLLAAWLLVWAGLAQAQTSKRMALVIGNATYQGEKPLRNPGNDAADVAAALQRAGITVQRHTNLGRTDMNRAIDSFMAAAEGAELAVVYYSGHGMQAGGEAFLIPTDAKIASERDVRSEGIRLGELMDDLEGKRIRNTLLIIDACRDNPYRSRTKSNAKGLARPKEMNGAFLVAYATADGTTADDGEGRNGAYTEQLLKQLNQSSRRNLRDLMEDTQLAVEESTKGAQRPKTYGDSAKFRNVYLLASVVAEPLKPAALPQPAPSQTLKDCAQCPELVVLPAGRFTMGSSAAEQALANAAGVSKERTDRESPQRTVSVRSFAAGKYAISKGEFAAFVQAKAYQTEAERGEGCLGRAGEREKDKARSWRNPGFAQGNDHPVVCVSYNDAQAYLQWLNQTSGKTFRLLSEAEREYAARAGSPRAFWWGDSINPTQANYNSSDSYNGSAKGPYRQATVPVNSLSANPFGLHNLHGNVFEWTADCFHDTYQGAPTDGSAWTTNCGGTAKRVIRGGSWFGNPAYVRSAFRGHYAPEARHFFLGFRLARAL